MSFGFSATGRKPFCVYHCTVRRRPSLVKSFSFLTSASDFIGGLREHLHPAGLPQWIRRTPLASSRFDSTGVSFSRMNRISASDSKKNGIPNTLKASSMRPRPVDVSSAASELIDLGPHQADDRALVALRAAFVNRQLHPAASVDLVQAAPMSASALYQTELRGTIVASRTVTGAAAQVHAGEDDGNEDEQGRSNADIGDLRI